MKNLFEEGKWYFYANWFGKFYIDPGSPHSFRVSETIEPDRIYRNNKSSWGSISDRSTGDCVLADMNEVSKYLPKTHPDYINQEQNYSIC